MSFFVENIPKKRPLSLKFWEFKLKFVTRTARYWYKKGIFHATNKQIFFIETPGVSLDQYAAPR